MVFGILAHVDAGKTTLSEGLLYTTGQLRTLGRVDHQDAYLDNDAQERERGITIFSKQARLEEGEWRAALLDTPGHVDFSAEMERTLSVIDYGILVISGTDGVQGHTRSIWRLLEHYRVPVFLFVNKMDLPGADQRERMEELRRELSGECVDFSDVFQKETGKTLSFKGTERFYEDLAVCGEELLNEYMDSGEIAVESIRKAIRGRKVFPCFFGSALKLEGVREFLDGLKLFAVRPDYPEEFSARVYKVGRDSKGARLTYLKLTGGTLAVKDVVEYDSRRGSSGIKAGGGTGTAGRVGEPGAIGRVGEPVVAGRAGGPGTAGRVGEPGAAGRLGESEAAGGFGETGTTGRVGGPIATGRFGEAGIAGRAVEAGTAGRAAEVRSAGKGIDAGIAGKGRSAGDQSISCREKVDQIRLYSGEKYTTADRIEAGEVCAVTGLTGTFPGQGIGADERTSVPVLEPVLTYQIFLPDGVNPVEMMGKLRQLEEEDPQLHLVWNEALREIHVQMMGQVQIEVLTRLIKERFDVTVVFGPGNIVYRETIAEPVEGIGHFEPMRHYAEVHLLLEPGEPGSGIQVASTCSEDVLDLNWQRLVATHILEREHPGVLTGSALTDVKFTILTGRAHLKHTEGGDFRQATYRAIRQGLKSTSSVLLEPYYRFLLEIPMEHVGRAMTDLRQRFGDFAQPEYLSGQSGERARITGRAPASTMQDYMSEVHAYTQGLGSLALESDGYDVCHNSEEVIVQRGYDSEADLANPAGSVFCAHGAGFVVPWDEVDQYMHLERVWHPAEDVEETDGYVYHTQGAGYRAEAFSGSGRKSWEKTIASMSELELDKELVDVYAREFGMSRGDVEEQSRKKWAEKSGKQDLTKGKTSHIKLDKKGNPIYPSKKKLSELLIVDGYNIIFAWEELAELSKVNIDAARDRLKDILLNYQGFQKCRMVVVFDAYRVKGNTGRTEWYDGKKKKDRRAGGAARPQDETSGLEVVYTKQDETADAFIERMVHDNRDKYRILVATSDGMEQQTVLSLGALRMSAKNLREEIRRMDQEWKDYL